MNNKNVTVYIPCFNEEKNISTLVKTWDKAISDFQNINVLFINNGSSDTTMEMLKYNIKASYNENLSCFDIKTNKGYGYGILEGITNDDSTHICWTHADLQFRAQDVVEIINKYLKNPADWKVYKGQRTTRSLYDKIFTNLMSFIGVFFKRAYISDINAQPKIFPRTIFNLISSWPTDFLLDAHLLYESKKHKFEIVNEKIELMPRFQEEAKGGGTLKGKIKLSLSSVKYFLGLYEKY
tara:strand:+ start:1310 stop:2023 length:714 start_codon:yes stop_codon:yes gene_type:complete